MAFIYPRGQTKPLKYPLAHDPDESKYYVLLYRAPTWSSIAEKKQAHTADTSGDTVMPSSMSGFYAECTSSGITDTVEPTWPSIEGATVADDTVEWTMHSDDFEFEFGDSIISSIWESDVGVVMDNPGIDGLATFTRITTVPVDAISFTLTNVLEVLRADGKTEILNRSIIVKIKEL